MAKQVSRTAFMNRVKKRAKGGWGEARNTEAKAKGAQLPDGIVNGVAQFTAYKMDFDKKGNPYIMLQGMVHEPEECARMKASTFHRITESKDDKGRVRKTVQDKLEDLSSDLQLLGCDVSEIDLDDLPDLLEALVEAAPFYRFNTVKFGNGPVNVFIQGEAEDFEGEPFEVEGEEEAEEPSEEAEEEAEECPFEVGQRVQVEYDGEPYGGEITEVDAEGETASINFDDGSSADHGFDEIEPEAEEPEADDEGDDEGGDTEAAGEEDWEPARGETYVFPFKKTAKAKPVKTAIEITSVSKANQTVNGKDEEGNPHSKIPWDQLEWPEE